MVSFDLYKQLLANKAEKLKLQKEAKFQANAEASKPQLLRYLYNTFPVFWELFDDELEVAPPVWFRDSPDSSLNGMPGILFRDHIFIGVRRDSDQSRIYLGCWSNQDSYTNYPQTTIQSFTLRIRVEPSEMDELRLAHERAFSDAINGCIYLINCNPKTYTKWRF